MKKAQQSFTSLTGGARGSNLSFPSPGRSRVAAVVGAVVAVVLIQQSMMTGVVAEADGGGLRKLGVLEDVHCGCGKDLNRELLVEPTADSACSPEKTRTPHELRGKGQQPYPLRAKVRRTPEGSLLLLNWRLTYLPRRKRTRLFDFHLLFVAKPTRKNRRQVGENGQCFRVSGLRRVCKRKVTCRARYSKSRPRGLSLRIFYQYQNKGKTPTNDDDDGNNNNKHYRSVASKGSGDRRRRAVNVLKSSLSQRTGPKRQRSRSRKQKNAKRKAEQRRREEAEERQGDMDTEELERCQDWIPSLTLSAEKDCLTVTLSPVNPFASELQLALHYYGSSLMINPTRIPVDTKNYTFSNVKKGLYSVSVRPRGPNCSQATSIYSRDSVNVTGGDSDSDGEDSSRTKRHNFKDCGGWLPNMTLEVRGRSVNGHYSPANHWATSMMIALQRPGSSLQLHATIIPQNVTTYTFENVEAGDYRMSIRARGPECRSARYIFSRDVVTVTDVEPPICSYWEPSFQAREISHGSWCLIEVDIDTPPNIGADKIQVALEEREIGSGRKNIVKQNDITVDQNKTVFNITKEYGKTYRALVRPSGCKDCKDFELYGEECFLSFYKTDVIAVTSSDGGKSSFPSGYGNEYRSGSTRLRVPHSIRHHHQHDDDDDERHDNYRHRGSGWARSSPTGTTHRRTPRTHIHGFYGNRHSRHCDDCCRRCGCHAASR